MANSSEIMMVRPMGDDAAPTVAEPAALVTVRVVEPFQVYWEQVVYVGGETVALPADVAARHVLAQWCELI